MKYLQQMLTTGQTCLYDHGRIVTAQEALQASTGRKWTPDEAQEYIVKHARDERRESFISHMRSASRRSGHALSA